MGKSPLVSIITPTYNHEIFIGQCIESVLAQRYKNWEQIIIDDGSVDRTSEIIKKYKDSRIRYIRQENLGIWQLGKTYNKALELSRGDFIAILEGDDYWYENKLAIQLPYFKEEKIILTWGKAVSGYNNKAIMSAYPKDFWLNKNTYQNIPPGKALRKLLLRNFISSVTVVVRKSILLKIGGFKQYSNLPLVDHPTWIELSLKGEFRFINETLGFWRRHPSQVSARFFKELLFKFAEFNNEFCNGLPTNLKRSMKINDKLVKSRYYWLKGRFGLTNKQWRGARKDLLQAFLNGSFLIKLKATIGIIASLFYTDVEKITELVYKEDRLILKNKRLT